MSNREKFLWGAFAGVLVMLFLLSSTDLIIKERKREVYPISVIISDTSDAYYTNFRKGMDKAAENLQADVSFITMYEANNVEEQIELLQREVRDGARAIILAPVNETEIIMELDQLSASCPIILLGSSTASDSIIVTIGIDGYETGKRLAMEIVNKESKDIPVWLLSEGLSYTGNRDLYDGIRSVLEEYGFTYHLIEKSGKDFLKKSIEETIFSGCDENILVGLDVESLEEAADTLRESSVYRQQATELYGIGSTISVLRYLDEGIVKGIMVSNCYDEGYTSVRRAVEAIQGMRLNDQIVSETFYIERENLRDPEYEKLLYPIE